MNKYHLEILEEIKRNAKEEKKELVEWLKKYMGTSKIYYPISSQTKKQICKNWLKSHPDLTFNEFIETLNSLYNGTCHQEISCASFLLELAPKFRKEINLQYIDRWLGKTEGWGEVDGLCQSNFSSSELLYNWEDWQKLLKKLNIDKNINKRRASLVLLVKSLRESGDQRLADLAFENIEKLKREKDVLITKAISWILRALTINNRNRVEKYIEENEELLPKIALRETKRKLLTGKK